MPLVICRCAVDGGVLAPAPPAITYFNWCAGGLGVQEEAEVVGHGGRAENKTNFDISLWQLLHIIAKLLN